MRLFSFRKLFMTCSCGFFYYCFLEIAREKRGRQDPNSVHGVKLIDTQCKTVAVIVSYDSELCGHEVCREFLVNPIVVHMK